MNLILAARLADELIYEHLSGWTWTWFNARTQFGLCAEFTDKTQTARTIYLSRPLTLLNDEAAFRDTVLHEIAHAKVGNAVGHTKLWKATARALGANPQRCSTGIAPEGNFYATCPNHGRLKGTRYKLTYAAIHNRVCIRCRAKIT